MLMINRGDDVIPDEINNMEPDIYICFITQ